MAIARKPKPHSPTPSVDVDALIRRGGSPGGAAAPADDGRATPILIRLPADMLGQLDRVLKARPVRLPRHTWILEAIHEKLSRETKS
jgi:hypothetical protein